MLTSEEEGREGAPDLQQAVSGHVYTMARKHELTS